MSPRIFTGLRISVAFAVLLLVLAEQLGSSNGIGWFVLYSQQGYDVPGMWAGILMLALLGIGAERNPQPRRAARPAVALQPARTRRLTPWSSIP